MPPLSRALITGASSGVGASLARLVCEKSMVVGHNLSGLKGLHLCGRNRRNLEAVAVSCRSMSPSVEVTTSYGDVGNAQDVERMWQEYQAAHGEHVDLVVLNAGLNRVGAIDEQSIEDFETVIRSNLYGVFYWLRLTVTQMKKRGEGGQIVVTNSVRGLRGGANAGAYTASKFAVRGLMQSLRAEVGKHGIRTGSVLPGGIDTPWWQEYKRGGRKPSQGSVDTSKFLSSMDVANAMMTIINQGDTSDIEEILLEAPPMITRPKSKM